VFWFLTAFGCLMLMTIVFLLRETNTDLNRDATRPAPTASAHCWPPGSPDGSA
jgi:hypothetical protein